MELADSADDCVFNEDISQINLCGKTDLARVLINSYFANFEQPWADWLDQTLHGSRFELRRVGFLGS